MAGKRKEQNREDRITNEIVVDAYDASERAMGWHYYLEEKLQFPFTATCTKARPISPLKVGDEVEVTGMAYGPKTRPALSATFAGLILGAMDGLQ